MTDALSQSDFATPRFPVAMLLAYLLGELAVLAWSAFPEFTMKHPQSLESWSYLAGFQAMFFTWAWPTLRIPLVSGRRVRQATIDAGLLACGAVVAVVPAVWWCDVPGRALAMSAGALVAMLVVGWLVVAIGRPRLSWAWCATMALVNFGLLGLGYLAVDFLGRDPQPFWLISPMGLVSWLAG